MTEVFIKAGTYILIICLAYFLKKIGFFKEGEHKTISKIVLNITLPAAILSSFNQVEQLSGQLFFILFYKKTTLKFNFKVILLFLLLP